MLTQRIQQVRTKLVATRAEIYLKKREADLLEREEAQLNEALAALEQVNQDVQAEQQAAMERAAEIARQRDAAAATTAGDAPAA